jgi:hypothetical protein
MGDNMKHVSNQLREVLDQMKPRLLALPEEDVSKKPDGEKWSLKEILGHLVDSASTNHQRIVRMQEKPDIGKLAYEQLHWVQSQNYASESWSDLVHLWYFYNKHLAHIIDHVNPATLANTCDIDYPKPATLQYVIQDYVRHVRHHLDQIFSTADPRSRQKWEPVQ